MRVLFGDRNGDGVYDDPPQDIDALHIRSSGGGVTSWLLSTSSTTALPGAPSLKDGDVFAFDGQGGISVAYSEAFFETVTLTSGVDIDAFAESPTGRIWFSFAEDEQTGSAALTNQNNGTSLLDEQTVFSFDPGDAEAVIAWSRSQVVQVFNAATGGGASTVVDITGVAPDPLHPGEVLLCCRSTNNNYRSRVVSTAGGGMAWVVAGQPVGPAAFSLTSDPILDALALTVEPPHPVLRVAQLPERQELARYDPWDVGVDDVDMWPLLLDYLVQPAEDSLLVLNDFALLLHGRCLPLLSDSGHDLLLLLRIHDLAAWDSSKD